ncbi:MAG TPA: hypothetical protein VN887_16600 [Candidatus Angelobacter sp.]|nr:hypothetical protein [Candidatus Angelobacter sp.]
MKTAFLTVLTLAGALQLVSGADITGKVILGGTPKPETLIDMATSFDKTCGAAHSEPVTTRHYVVSKDGGLADVFVYIKSGVSQRKLPVPAQEPMLDQVGCLFEPYVMGVMVNQEFRIRNSDPTLHNVHAQPRQGANKEFNLGQVSKDQVSKKQFPSPEVMVRFKCDVHPWMFAYVGVVDNPYYAVTGKDGTFKISGVPNGKYTLEAYHPKTHGTNRGISKEIAVNGNTNVDFTIELK